MRVETNKVKKEFYLMSQDNTIYLVSLKIAFFFNLVCFDPL